MCRRGRREAASFAMGLEAHHGTGSTAPGGRGSEDRAPCFGRKPMQLNVAAIVRGLFIAVMSMMATAASAATYLYVGNAGSNEIFVYALDPKSGELTPIAKLTVPGITKAGGSIPMSVSPNKKFLYAGFRGEPQVAATFTIDSKTGKLTHVGNGPLADSMA